MFQICSYMSSATFRLTAVIAPLAAANRVPVRLKGKGTLLSLHSYLCVAEMRRRHCQHSCGGGGSGEGRLERCGPTRCRQRLTCRGVLCQMIWLHLYGISALSMGLFSPLNSRAGRHSTLSPRLFSAPKSPLSDWPFLCRADGSSVPNTPPQYVYKKRGKKKQGALRG